ncbi:MAG: thioredoxin family protein [Parvularculaceae bacterium]
MRSIALSVLMALASSAAGAAVAPVVTAHAETTLLPEKTGVEPGKPLWVALDQKMDEGWHVYWKNPGDSGLPLDLRWRLPEGFTAGETVYPLPEQIPIGPLANFGHHGKATFLIPIMPPAELTTEAVEIGLKATWLICEEICVPEEGAFLLSLPVGAGATPHAEGAPVVAAARKALPPPVEAAFTATAAGVVLKTKAPAKFSRAFFFPHTEGVVEPSAPQEVVRKNGELTVKTKGGFAYKPEEVETLKGVLVFEDGSGTRFGYDIDAARQDGGAPPTSRLGAAPQDASLIGLLFAAFFGGMLLNIMPCVFPILFLKAAAWAKGAGASPAQVRRDALLYVAGVVATFAALGGLLLALRAGGAALGWGFHLQSPLVVLLSAYVLFLVGLNLAGVFTVGSSLQNVGAGAAAQGGPLSAFATGALAVFVAAPCIGPLLSAPMGAAAALPPVRGMAIYLTLALGFALPFALLSFAPALSRLLPKPGAWMSVFKQVLAFPVFASAAFFLWVLTEQTGTAGLARALSGALLLAFAAFLFERSKGAGTALMRAGAAAVAVLALMGSVDLKLVDAAQAEEKRYGDLKAFAYDEAQIATLRESGRGVFIDFTAAWCVTCQVNKMTVLSSKSLAAAFAAQDTALMSADWTRRDPQITKALSAFGANGVPLYIYYPPQGEPRQLSQPLTERAIIEAIQS